MGSFLETESVKGKKKKKEKIHKAFILGVLPQISESNNFTI